MELETEYKIFEFAHGAAVVGTVRTWTVFLTFSKCIRCNRKTTEQQQECLEDFESHR